MVARALKPERGSRRPERKVFLADVLLGVPAADAQQFLVDEADLVRVERLRIPEEVLVGEGASSSELLAT